MVYHLNADGGWPALPPRHLPSFAASGRLGGGFQVDCEPSNAFHRRHLQPKPTPQHQAQTAEAPSGSFQGTSGSGGRSGSGRGRGSRSCSISSSRVSPEALAAATAAGLANATCRYSGTAAARTGGLYQHVLTDDIIPGSAAPGADAARAAAGQMTNHSPATAQQGAGAAGAPPSNLLSPSADDRAPCQAGQQTDELAATPQNSISGPSRHVDAAPRQPAMPTVFHASAAQAHSVWGHDGTDFSNGAATSRLQQWRQRAQPGERQQQHQRPGSPCAAGVAASGGRQVAERRGRPGSACAAGVAASGLKQVAQLRGKAGRMQTIGVERSRSLPSRMPQHGSYEGVQEDEEQMADEETQEEREEEEEDRGEGDAFNPAAPPRATEKFLRGPFGAQTLTKQPLLQTTGKAGERTLAGHRDTSGWFTHESIEQLRLNRDREKAAAEVAGVDAFVPLPGAKCQKRSARLLPSLRFPEGEEEGTGVGGGGAGSGGGVGDGGAEWVYGQWGGGVNEGREGRGVERVEMAGGGGMQIFNVGVIEAAQLVVVGDMGAGRPIHVAGGGSASPGHRNLLFGQSHQLQPMYAGSTSATAAGSTAAVAGGAMVDAAGAGSGTGYEAAGGVRGQFQSQETRAAIHLLNDLWQVRGPGDFCMPAYVE